MKESGQNLEKYAGMPTIYAGGSVRRLGAEKLATIASVVCAELAKHSNTMIQYSSDVLTKSMNEGRSSAVLGSTGELSAFAQFWPYQVENDGDENLQELKGKEVFEVGSWLSFGQSQGKKAFEACLAVGKMMHPGAKFIGIVEKDNARAAQQLKEMGGKVIGWKRTLHVRGRDDAKAEMIIYDMCPEIEDTKGSVVYNQTV